MFAGRRAVILKSHGFDLLQEKEEQRNTGEVVDVLLSPGTWFRLFLHMGPYLKASRTCSFRKYLCHYASRTLLGAVSPRVNKTVLDKKTIRITSAMKWGVQMSNAE